MGEYVNCSCVNALVKRSVSLAEMNNKIILLQQYNSFCLYIATVSIKFLLIPPFSLSRKRWTRVEDEAVKNANWLRPGPDGV